MPLGANHHMKKLPIGIQSIREILEEDQVYVDKTGFAKELIENGKHYFMSRPRRFGKSLFLSTLEEVFKGNKELFKGCHIYDTDYDWQKYPVLCFDFAQILINTPKHLEESLRRAIESLAKTHDESIEVPSAQEGLINLIKALSKKNRVVVLVDEYDHPIINNLKHPDTAEQNRDLLKNFFGTLKSLDQYLKFSFVTGVSKFSQVSLFSGPNNLKDITMDPRYAAMMGYTGEEIKKSFSEYIQAIVEKRNQNKDSVLEEVREWYNGYRFSKEQTYVYNPFSTLNYMDEKEATSYWYSTGTPSFLIDEVKKRPQLVIPLRGISVLKGTLSDISKLDRIHLAALMFQTGYLTIRDYNPEERSYQLDFPNREVKEAFFNSLLQEFTEMDPLEVSRAAGELRNDLETHDLCSFVKTINHHFAKMPYYLFTHAKEGFYQAVFFTFLEKSGIKTYAEIPTNIGRIDLFFELGNTIYIFELKVDQTAEIALTQAETKRYKEKYFQNNKDILVVGINFTSESRNIGEWKGTLFASSGKPLRDIQP